MKEALRGHVVVEMCDLDNEHLVKLVGGEFIETIVSHDVIGRLMIQCAMQPGLAQVSLLNLSSIFVYFYLISILSSSFFFSHKAHFNQITGSSWLNNHFFQMIVTLLGIYC